ncbi:MAG: carboxypeptidase regulatory-like domain-containing protein [Terriglobales bacterium]
MSRLSVILLVTAAMGYCQIAAGQTSSTAGAQSYSVRGTVINSVTGEPLARALVTLTTQRQQAAMTDANGSFHFEEVRGGSASLIAQRPGFFPPGQLTTFVISADIDSLVLPLAPQAVISGHVASVLDVPIEDLPVRLYRRTYVNGRMQWQPANTAASDDDGQFRIAGLAAGTYCLSAGPENWRQRAHGSRLRGYPQVFYPNAADFASASLVTVAAGQQVEADFSLTQEPLFEISGQVVGVPPGMDPGLQLMNSSGDSVPLREMPSHRHEFTANVPAGRYLLKAFAANESQSLRAEMPLGVSSNATGIRLVLGVPSSIAVNVRTDSGENSGRQQAVAVMLTPTAPSSSPRQLWARPAGKRGSMEIDGAEPTTYSVEITPYDKYVISATSGSTDLLQDDLLVSADGRAGPIEIVLGSDGGEVRGTVHLPEHASGATVFLVPEHGSARQIKSADVPITGEFQFQQVRPGDYSLLALEHGDDLEYQNPDVLSSYMSNATRISVAPKQQVNATLELTSPGK